MKHPQTRALKGYGFSRAARDAEAIGFSRRGNERGFPQWLKPTAKKRLYGTAEAVPLESVPPGE